MAKLPNAKNNPDPTVKALMESLAAKRGSVGDMYGTMLNHPELTQHVSELGSYLRFHGVLPNNIREFTILCVARLMNVRYEWVKHVEIAKQSIDLVVIEHLRHQEIDQLHSPYQLFYTLTTIVLAQQSIPDNLQAQLIELIEIKGLIECVVLIGFYAMIAHVVAAFDVELPPDTQSPW